MKDSMIAYLLILVDVGNRSNKLDIYSMRVRLSPFRLVNLLGYAVKFESKVYKLVLTSIRADGFPNES